MHQPKEPWVMSLTEPSQALRKEEDRKRAAISVGNVVRWMVWNREDSQLGKASRKSENAPGGGGLEFWRSGLVGCWTFQPLGVGRMVVGTADGGTGKLEWACAE
jgi:hypothetical protein